MGEEGPPYSRYLSYRTRGTAVILTIEYCSVVRRSCAGRETMADDNPYYSPKGTLSIVMLGHWASIFAGRFSPENNVRLCSSAAKKAVCTRSLCAKCRALFFMVSVDVWKSTRNPNKSSVPDATRVFNRNGELLTLYVVLRGYRGHCFAVCFARENFEAV